MTYRFHLSTLLGALTFLSLVRADAALLTDTANYAPNVLIPDNSIVGVADTRIFSSAITSITEVRLTLEIAGEPSTNVGDAPGDAFNGDYYAYLTHSSGFAVLLNRTGRTLANPFGYADSGFLVTFDDSPAGNDIHNYQLVSNPGGGVLTGTWGTDGRNVSPFTVLDTTPRTTSLASFNGLDANGAWTLFVADVSPLGLGRLASWQLQVTGNTAVPEPGTALAGVLCLGAVLARRRGK